MTDALLEKEKCFLVNSQHQVTFPWTLSRCIFPVIQNSVFGGFHIVRWLFFYQCTMKEVKLKRRGLLLKVSRLVFIRLLSFSYAMPSEPPIFLWSFSSLLIPVHSEWRTWFLACRLLLILLFLVQGHALNIWYLNLEVPINVAYRATWKLLMSDNPLLVCRISG